MSGKLNKQGWPVWSLFGTSMQLPVSTQRPFVNKKWIFRYNQFFTNKCLNDVVILDFSLDSMGTIKYINNYIAAGGFMYFKQLYR